MRKAIEVNFPFEEIDPIAELESWRKEVNRPIYHIHKWWANRLGSVFRAILIGAMKNEGESIWAHFYKSHNFKGKVVLDPFMGSGTTLGECAKLGIKAIGCDINPVSSFIVKQALTRIDIRALEENFELIRRDVQEEVSRYYKTIDSRTGKPCDVLYYFWVKTVRTDSGEEIPLFSNFVFSKNAYPKLKPTSQILCPECWQINEGRYDSTRLVCKSCGNTFNPQIGPAQGQCVRDKHGRSHKIKELVVSTGKPPEHRLYAIMALTESGEKVYQAPQKFDFDLYAKASRELSKAHLPLPDMEIRSGHNTNQARGYNYRNWNQFFNDRQLLSLGKILDRVLQIKDETIREHFLCLFSSTLEFNNLFCSFKGEGTGAVRHMFSNHILKPERTPLEANVWGTPKSSGCFSSLFRSRLLRAKEYLDNPFEVREVRVERGKTSEKMGCNPPLNVSVVPDYESFSKKENAVLVLNGDSAKLPIPDGSVDAVVTDPPYFDFVHYSELSDFFYAWLSPVLKQKYRHFQKKDCSDLGEVQDKSPSEFSKNLCRVFKDCHRVLKDGGLLTFSFHHSRAEAWMSIYEAIINAGFVIEAAHPVKAEMAGGNPKSAASNPINLDAIMVCKKGRLPKFNYEDILSQAKKNYADYCERFEQVQREISMGDKKVILASQILIFCSRAGVSGQAVEVLLAKAFDWIGEPEEELQMALLGPTVKYGTR